jgi:hypothetical protein
MLLTAAFRAVHQPRRLVEQWSASNQRVGLDCNHGAHRFDHTCVHRGPTIYFVLPPSTFNLSLAPACAAARRAVSTRNGEQAT